MLTLYRVARAELSISDYGPAGLDGDLLLADDWEEWKVGVSAGALAAAEFTVKDREADRGKDEWWQLVATAALGYDLRFLGLVPDWDAATTVRDTAGVLMTVPVHRPPVAMPALKIDL